MQREILLLARDLCDTFVAAHAASAMLVGLAGAALLSNAGPKLGPMTTETKILYVVATASAPFLEKDAHAL
jgi:hypothetical protein